MIDEDNETELLRLIAVGDEIAFRKIYITYYQLLHQHIYNLTESIETADEIVQDVFLKIWNTRESLEVVVNFKAYLFVVSKNYAISCLRKDIRRSVLHNKWLSEELNSSVKAEEAVPELSYYGILDKAIDQLPQQQKKVYLLSRHEKLTYVEVANQMAISRETVKKYLKLATVSITQFVKNSLNGC